MQFIALQTLRFSAQRLALHTPLLPLSVPDLFGHFAFGVQRQSTSFFAVKVFELMGNLLLPPETLRGSSLDLLSIMGLQLRRKSGVDAQIAQQRRDLFVQFLTADCEARLAIAIVGVAALLEIGRGAAEVVELVVVAQLEQAGQQVDAVGLEVTLLVAACQEGLSFHELVIRDHGFPLPAHGLILDLVGRADEPTGIEGVVKEARQAAAQVGWVAVHVQAQIGLAILVTVALFVHDAANVVIVQLFIEQQVPAAADNRPARFVLDDPAFELAVHMTFVVWWRLLAVEVAVRGAPYEASGAHGRFHAATDAIGQHEGFATPVRESHADVHAAHGIEWIDVGVLGEAHQHAGCGQLVNG